MKRSLIIIPAYNEEQCLGKVLEELQHENLDADIVVINDGSTDRTLEIATQFNVYVLSHACNLGYGASIQTGYKYAMDKGYDYIIQIDADGQHNTKDLMIMIQLLQDERHDLIIGSRFLGESSMYISPYKNAAFSFFNGLIYLTTKVKITDPTSGFRGMRKKVFSGFADNPYFPVDYPDANLLIQMILSEYKIFEFPTKMRERLHGKSRQHSGFKPIIYMMRMILSILVVLLRSKMINERKNYG